MAKNLKQLCAGIATAVVLSGAGAYFINKQLEEDSKKKKEHETEQVVKDMSTQGISITKKGVKGAPDSVLVSVQENDNTWYGGKVYHDPQYKARENEDPKTFRLDGKVKHWVTNDFDEETIRLVVEKIKELRENGATSASLQSILKEIAKQRPMHAPVEEETQYFGYEKFDRDFKNIEKDGFWSVTSKDAEAKHEQVIYDDGSKKFEFGYEEFGGNGNIEKDGFWSVTSKDAEAKHEQVVKNLIAHERATIHNDDNTFEATTIVRLRSHKFSHSLKFGNPEEQQIATQQQRAPKKKNTKRTVSRDALPGRNLAQIKANKKQNG